jgi:hypothetical protein
LEQAAAAGATATAWAWRRTDGGVANSAANKKGVIRDLRHIAICLRETLDVPIVAES